MSVWCIVIPAVENSPTVQWLALHAFFAKWAGSLPRVQTGELRSHKLWHGKKKKKNNLAIKWGWQVLAYTIPIMGRQMTDVTEEISYIDMYMFPWWLSG